MECISRFSFRVFISVVLLATLTGCPDDPVDGNDVAADLLDVIGGDVDGVTPGDAEVDGDVPRPDLEVELTDGLDQPDEVTLVDDKPEPDETPDIEVVEAEIAPICTKPCETNADCEGTLGELNKCQQAKCVEDDACTEDDDPANDKQCMVVELPKPCCLTDEDCDDDNICTADECNDDNECEYSPEVPVPDECSSNQVLLELNFNGYEDCSDWENNELPPPDKLKVTGDTNQGDMVTWNIQPNPCGELFGCALYLGDPECHTYHNGQLEECEPVMDLPCAPETEDEDCPAPHICGANFKCSPTPKPEQVKLDLVIPEVQPPPNAFTWLKFRIWMKAEYVFPQAPLFLEPDALKLFAKTVEGVEELEYSSMDMENSTLDQGTGKYQCVLVGVNLSKYAGQSIDIIWRFDSIDGTNNDFEGIYLDDIEIATYSDSDTCLNTANCDDDDTCTIDECATFANEASGGVCEHFQSDPDCEECCLDCGEPDLEDACEGEGPHPEDPFCFPPKCLVEPGKEIGKCQWLPNPDCCNEDNTEEFYDEGLEGGQLPDGYEIEEQQVAVPVKWQVAPEGCSEGPGSPDIDTFGFYFGNPEGDLEEWNFDCGESHCFGSLIGPKIDLGQIDEKANAKLTFWLNLGTEWDDVEDEDYVDAGIDTLKVYVLEDAMEDVEIWSSSKIFGSTHGECLPMWADLTPWAGKKISLRFEFDSGDVEPPANDFFGALVDEINVQSVCDEICTVDTDCVSPNECDAGTCEGGACVYELITDCCTKPNDVNCDDEDVCTIDSCNTAAKTCVHDYNDDPACCTPKDSIFLDSFTDQEGIDEQQLDMAKWMVPVPNAKCGNGQPEPDDGETCTNCPADMDVCPVAWRITDHKAFSGKYSMYFGNPGAWTYANGPEPAFGEIMSPPVVLPEYGIPVVQFNLNLDTEHSGTVQFYETNDFDKLSLFVQHGVDEPVKVWDSMDWGVKGSTKGQWKVIQAGIGDSEVLADLLGKEVHFVFRFDSLDVSNNDYEGAYIDDFKVRTECIDGYECFSAIECEFSPPDEEPDCTIESCDPITNICSFVPNGLKEGCCAQDMLAEYNFEGANCKMQGWSATPPNAPVKWQVYDGQGACQDSCALYFGNPQTGNYNNPGAPVAGTVCSPPINVTGHDQVEVSFFMWADLGDAQHWLDEIEFEMDSALFQNTGPMGNPMAVWHKSCEPILDTECAAPENDPPTPDSPCDEYGCDGTEMMTCKQFNLMVDLTTYDWVPVPDRWAHFCFDFNSQDAAGNKNEGLYIDQFQVKTTCQ